MDNRTILSLVVMILSLMLLRFAFRLVIMGIGYFIGFVIPLILINILYLLTWIIRPDLLYKDIKLFIEDRKTKRLGPLDFINRFFFIPGY